MCHFEWQLSAKMEKVPWYLSFGQSAIVSAWKNLSYKDFHGYIFIKSNIFSVHLNCDTDMDNALLYGYVENMHLTKKNSLYCHFFYFGKQAESNNILHFHMLYWFLYSLKDIIWFWRLVINPCHAELNTIDADDLTQGAKAHVTNIKRL